MCSINTAGHSVCNPYCKVDYSIITPCTLTIKDGRGNETSIPCGNTPTIWKDVLKQSTFDALGGEFVDWRPPQRSRMYEGVGYELFKALRDQTKVVIGEDTYSVTITVGVPTLQFDTVVNNHIGHGKRAGASIATRQELDKVDWAKYVTSIDHGMAPRGVQKELEVNCGLKTDIQTVKNRIAAAKLEKAVQDEIEWQSQLTADGQQATFFAEDDLDRLMSKDALNSDKVVMALIEENVTTAGDEGGVYKRIVKFPGNDSNWYVMPEAALDTATNATVRHSIQHTAFPMYRLRLDRVV